MHYTRFSPRFKIVVIVCRRYTEMWDKEVPQEVKATGKMVVGPPESAIRSRLQTASSGCY